MKLSSQLYIGFILSSSLGLIFGMELQVAPAQERASTIPKLQALVARHFYRNFCEDIDYSQRLLSSPTISYEAKQLMRESIVEMEQSLKQFILSWIRLDDPSKFIIYLDHVGACYFNNNKISGETILRKAIWDGRYDIIRLLFNLGMPRQNFVQIMVLFWDRPKEYSTLLHTFLGFKGIDIKDKFNNWPLIIAASKNGTHEKDAYCKHGDLLYSLLWCGADSNARDDKTGQTPLMCLSNNNSCKSCIRLLINRGADIEATDDKGMRAIAYAVNAGNLDAFAVLMEHNAATGVTYGGETLFNLARRRTDIPEFMRMLRIKQQP